MAELTYREAGRRSLAEALARDPAVWTLGVGLGAGGMFGQYRELQSEFGQARVVDAPISEAAMLGVAVGAALQGTRPVVELGLGGFALCAMDELVNQAAKLRYMAGGQLRVPLVLRQPIGLGQAAAAQHSQSLEAWYVHVPGLVVVAPATPADNYALLRAAIACDDPVVYLEHQGLWTMTGEVDVTVSTLLGKARLVRAGDALTLVSWSAQLHEAARAAELLANQGVGIELLDLRTLYPWDQAAVAASVAKTGRLLVVHEAVQCAGLGAEIAATIADRCFAQLKAPVRRLGAPRMPVAYAPPLEQAFKITAERDIVPAIEAMLG